MLTYTIQQQDGTKVTMTCPDTSSNRAFVAWVQQHDPSYNYTKKGGAE